MSEEVADLCRQYVANNIEIAQNLNEEEAVKVFCDGFRLYAIKSGWDANEVDSHVNVEELVRSELRRSA